MRLAGCGDARRPGVAHHVARAHRRPVSPGDARAQRGVGMAQYRRQDLACRGGRCLGDCRAEQRGRLWPWPGGGPAGAGRIALRRQRDLAHGHASHLRSHRHQIPGQPRQRVGGCIAVAQLRARNFTGRRRAGGAYPRRPGRLTAVRLGFRQSGWRLPVRQYDQPDCGSRRQSCRHGLVPGLFRYRQRGHGIDLPGCASRVSSKRFARNTGRTCR